MSFPMSTPVNPASVLMSSAGCPCAQNVGPQVAPTCNLQPIVQLPTPSPCAEAPPGVCVSCGVLPPQDPCGCLYKKNKPMNCCNTVNYNVPWLGSLKKAQYKGLCGTIAGFYPTSSAQNTVTGNGTISLDTYQTKLHASGDSVVVLPDGFMPGALKSIVYAKGTGTVIVTSQGNKFVQNCSLVFRNIMDQALLLWTGHAWVVLSTLNLCCNGDGPILQQVSFSQPCATTNPYAPPSQPVPISSTGPTGNPATGASGITGL